MVLTAEMTAGSTQRCNSLLSCTRKSFFFIIKFTLPSWDLKRWKQLHENECHTCWYVAKSQTRQLYRCIFKIFSKFWSTAPQEGLTKGLISVSWGHFPPLCHCVTLFFSPFSDYQQLTFQKINLALFKANQSKQSNLLETLMRTEPRPKQTILQVMFLRFRHN